MGKLQGVIAAVATPLKEDRSIDLERLIGHCRWLLADGGCDGINLLGTTGEATSFSVAARIDAMQAIAGSGLPLECFMVGTGAAALADAVRLTAEAKALGFAGALLLPPFYYKGIDADGLVAYVEAVVERVGRDGLPLYLYHFPQNSGVPYSIDVVARLREAHADVVLGLKDSSGDLEYSAALVRRLEGFAVFPSAEASLGRARELGFAGCISATANVTGPFAQRAWSGSAAVAREGLAGAVEIRAAIAQFPLVAAVKASLALLTEEPAWRTVMPPLSPLSEDELGALDRALRATALMAD
ncbi:4-hydroxy-tetrahydrodipicolinate synthase [Rhizobiales bacterium GAS191]|jgi:4-hydroxy-tetrahydrodipicolinate synthase|nr:4-hydroxy-tetrahydrodipicolinate synthase [Rhizobiales bacterium GAS113]SEE68436.1 4-hydroxy-tetrahydrodipicolinate synthase [Rhizobiales bacterium GAS191]SEF07758.1 4-hydroxy-tetrahydrodipicolinate synthase [Rhizobiales bacterium GAS188]